MYAHTKRISSGVMYSSSPGPEASISNSVCPTKRILADTRLVPSGSRSSRAERDMVSLRGGVFSAPEGQVKVVVIMFMAAFVVSPRPSRQRVANSSKMGKCVTEHFA